MTYDLFATETAQAAQREEAQRIVEQHRAEAIRLLMQSRSGRIFVRDFLTFCGVFASPQIRTNEAQHFNEGLRRAGMYVFTAIAADNPTHIPTLFQEVEQ